MTAPHLLHGVLRFVLHQVVYTHDASWKGGWCHRVAWPWKETLCACVRAHVCMAVNTAGRRRTQSHAAREGQTQLLEKTLASDQEETGDKVLLSRSGRLRTQKRNPFVLGLETWFRSAPLGPRDPMGLEKTLFFKMEFGEKPHLCKKGQKNQIVL